MHYVKVDLGLRCVSLFDSRVPFQVKFTEMPKRQATTLKSTTRGGCAVPWRIDHPISETLTRRRSVTLFGRAGGIGCLYGVGVDLEVAPFLRLGADAFLGPKELKGKSNPGFLGVSFYFQLRDGNVGTLTSKILLCLVYKHGGCPWV